MKTKSILLLLAVCVAMLALVFWSNKDRSASPTVNNIPATKPGDITNGPSSETVATPAAPAQKLPESDVVSAAQAVSGRNGETMAARWKAAQNLGNNLKPQEIEDLYGYLRSHEVETNKAMRGVLKNQVILTLKTQTTPPAGLAAVLTEVFTDRTQDVVIRDYALQHLITSQGDSADSAAIQPVLWKALEETDSSIAGTALIGLHRLSRTDSGIDANRIDRSALEIVQSEQTGDLARISAMQVCAERRVTAALPAILPVTGSANSIPLRISAVAAVGTLGGAEQIVVLEGLRAETNSPIQTAVEAALRKLRKSGEKG